MSLSFEDTDTPQPVYALTASWVDGSKYINPESVRAAALANAKDALKEAGFYPKEPTEPTITLKRGRVEISIKNAASIVQRMEELFPKNERYGSGHSWTRSQEKIYDHDKNRAWVIAAKNWFKQEFYGTNDEDFDIIVSNEQQSTSQQNMSPSEKFAPLEPDRAQPLPFPCPPPVEKTVNKNAYEIRTDILGMALDFVKFKKEVSNQLETISDDDVLNTAQKFYKFVENRR